MLFPKISIVVFSSLVVAFTFNSFISLLLSVAVYANMSGENAGSMLIPSIVSADNLKLDCTVFSLVAVIIYVLVVPSSAVTNILTILSPSTNLSFPEISTFDLLSSASAIISNFSILFGTLIV